MRELNNANITPTTPAHWQDVYLWIKHAMCDKLWLPLIPCRTETL